MEKGERCIHLLLKTGEKYAGQPFVKIMYSCMKVRLASQALVVHATDLLKWSEPMQTLERRTGKLEGEQLGKERKV